jgi:polyhydroxyalkanoate synthesis regulator phasin
VRNDDEGVAGDAKDAVDDLLQRLVDRTAEANEKHDKIVSLTDQRDDYKAMFEEATAQIERLKKMAFEEIVREITEEKLNH